jgi:ATP-dependent Clp protease adaptor protein ClpS
MSTTYNPIEEEILLLDEEVKQENQIILYNDDVNTFDWVIESLVKVCRHDHLQAEQCSMIVHYQGKCAVKEGAINVLKPMCEALQDRGLSATIE